MKKLIAMALSFWVFSAFAQELIEFENGQVADAGKINQNFRTLKNKIDEGIETSEDVTWLGYTDEVLSFYLGNLVETVYLNNPFWLSKACKAQFGPSAFVMTEAMVERLVMTGNTFTLPGTIPVTDPAPAILLRANSNSEPMQRQVIGIDFRGQPRLDWDPDFSVVACVELQ